MGSGNTPIDVETGIPLAEKKRLDAIEKQNETIERGVDAQNALKGEDGRILISFIIDRLEGKLNQFLQSDPECSTLVKLLTELNYTANIGRRRAINRLTEILGDDTPPWVNNLA